MKLRTGGEPRPCLGHAGEPATRWQPATGGLSETLRPTVTVRMGDSARSSRVTCALRQRLVALRADGTIGDAAFQRVEEELDWGELDWAQLVRSGEPVDGKR